MPRMLDKERRKVVSRLGTCRHNFQIQEMYEVPVHRQPHQPAEVRIDRPEVYTCEWLRTLGSLPPPLARASGGFVLAPTDCDNCACYEAVKIAIPGLK